MLMKVDDLARLAPVSPESSTAVGRPSTYTIRALAPGAVMVAADPACWRYLVQAVDRLGPDAVLRDDQVFPLVAGTPVRVLRRALTRVKVQVLEGPYAGRTGYVPPGIY